MGTLMATETATLEGVAPPVRLEACAGFRPESAMAGRVCDACGWLEDDHAPPITGGAVVTRLPGRDAPRIERKAS
jgi:hypothetical protein